MISTLLIFFFGCLFNADLVRPDSDIIGKPQTCFQTSDCNSGETCRLPARPTGGFNPGVDKYGFNPMLIKMLMPGKCEGVPKVPSPPMKMTFELCILPQSYGRSSGRPIDPSINIVIVTCNPMETCVESDSTIHGNEFGICSKSVMPNNVETTTVDRIINQGKEEIVKPGMNYCNVKLNNGFFPTKRAESKSEFNFVSCGPKRFCQPLDREGEGLSEIGTCQPRSEPEQKVKGCWLGTNSQGRSSSIQDPRILLRIDIVVCDDGFVCEPKSNSVLGECVLNENEKASIGDKNAIKCQIPGRPYGCPDGQVCSLFKVCVPILEAGINLCIPEGSNPMNLINGRSSKPLKVNIVTCIDGEICQPKPNFPQYGTCHPTGKPGEINKVCRLPNSGIQQKVLGPVKYEVVECREKYETCNATIIGSLPVLLPGLENIYGLCVSKFASGNDVYVLAEEIGTFKTLLEIGGRDFFERIKGPQNSAVTLFAPTDEAFASLPEGFLDSLTPKEKEKLVFRHVVKQRTILAADVTTIDEMLTDSDEEIALYPIDQGGFKIRYGWNFFDVVDFDLKATNGVIHVLDKVIYNNGM